MNRFKIGDDVEILISSSDFYLHIGEMATIVDIVTDKNDKPVLAVIKIDNNEVDKWNKNCFTQFRDNGLRNIALDHIRLPK